VNATTSALARIAGVAIVLILAAAVGLLAGNALNARDAGPAGGPGPFPNVWGDHADIAAPIEAPGSADPVTSESWGNVAEVAGRESLTGPSLR
jgi:hypothetical protein